MNTGHASRPRSAAPIVVGVDGSDAAGAAIRWAATEAVRHGCALHVVHAATSTRRGDRIVPDTRGEEIVAEAEVMAKAAATPFGSVEVVSSVIDSPAVPTLVEMSVSARFVVVGRGRRTGLGPAMVGSVSGAVARRARCPVVVVPRADTPAGTDAERPVVVGVDGSMASVGAIGVAFEEAALRGAELVAVHSWNDRGLRRYGCDIVRIADTLLTDNLRPFQQRYPEVHVHHVVTGTSPAQELLAAGTAQLLVVGSHGCAGPITSVLGSVSLAVLHGARTPLVIVRR